MLSRDQILQADDLPRKKVTVPEWGGDVFIRVMTSAERDAFEASLTADRTTNIRARLAIKTLCDEQGNLLFTEGDEAALGAKSGSAIDRIWAESVMFNAISKKDISDLEKKSEAIPSNGSSTV